MDCDDSGSEKGEKEKKSMGGVERVIFCQDHDYLHQIQDEICLEGLDGITLQALWLRLANRPGYSLGLSQEAKLFIWSCVLALEEVRLYQLNQARNDLVLHDRQRTTIPICWGLGCYIFLILSFKICQIIGMFSLTGQVPVHGW